MTRTSDRTQTAIHMAGIASCALLTRILFLHSPAGRIGSADEAVFGLMALNILALKDFPIYCWEAQYAGAPVSYVAAVIFKLFGAGFVQLRMVMVPVNLAACILFYFIYRKLFGATGALIGALFLVFCPYLVMFHALSALGGYGETLLGSALIILASWHLYELRDADVPRFLFFGLGLLCGFFFYVFFLVLPAILAFAVPLLFVFPKARGRHALLYACGGFTGLLPFFLHNLLTKGGTFFRAAGRSLSVEGASLHTPPGELLIEILRNKTTYWITWCKASPLLMARYAVPDHWSPPVLLIAGSALLLFLGVFALVTLSGPSSHNGDERRFFIRSFAWYLILLIVFQWIANLNQARHLLPLITILPVAFLSLSEAGPLRRTLALSAMLLISAGFVSGWVREFRVTQFDPAPVVRFLEQENIRAFYGSYWVTYPVIFEARESIVGSPCLLRNGDIISDRRKAYTDRVSNSADVAYVFDTDQEHLWNDFNAFLASHAIQCTRATLQGTHIACHLSTPVRPVIQNLTRTLFVLPDSNEVDAVPATHP